MRLTPRRLNRATLARQLLLRREPLGAADALRRVVALQAQEPASPYIALWSRIDRFEPADLDAAFAAREVVKATLARITLHAVHAEDLSAFHSAMLPTLRASRLHDRRFLDTGLTPADADALLPQLLDFAAQPRTGAELEDLLEQQLGERKPRVWWALKTFAPLVHARTGGPWSFGSRSSFVAAPELPPVKSHEEGARRLVRRYLEGFGPASLQDIAQFSLLRQPVIRDALRTLAPELSELEGPGGAKLFDVVGAPLPPEDTPAPPRLLPMWDSILLAYSDRSRVLAPDLKPNVIRRNGDVLPTLLADGFVAGVWRPVDGGIEATAFHPLPEDAWSGLAEEAKALGALLADRDPAPYRRYAHWWKTLPRADVRVLAH